jgi:hypothetical protein
MFLYIPDNFFTLSLFRVFNYANFETVRKKISLTRNPVLTLKRLNYVRFFEKKTTRIWNCRGKW